MRSTPTVSEGSVPSLRPRDSGLIGHEPTASAMDAVARHLARLPSARGFVLPAVLLLTVRFATPTVTALLRVPGVDAQTRDDALVVYGDVRLLLLFLTTAYAVAGWPAASGADAPKVTGRGK